MSDFHNQVLLAFTYYDATGEFSQAESLEMALEDVLLIDTIPGDQLKLVAHTLNISI